MLWPLLTRTVVLDQRTVATAFSGFNHLIILSITGTVTPASTDRTLFWCSSECEQQFRGAFPRAAADADLVGGPVEVGRLVAAVNFARLDQLAGSLESGTRVEWLPFSPDRGSWTFMGRIKASPPGRRSLGMQGLEGDEWRTYSRCEICEADEGGGEDLFDRLKLCGVHEIRAGLATIGFDLVALDA